MSKIEMRIGKRRIRVDLTKYDTTKKLVITICYPNSFSNSWSDERLNKEADNLLNSSRKEIVSSVLKIIDDNLAKIDYNKYPDVIKKIIKDFMNNIGDSYNSIDYKEKLSNKFKSLHKTIKKTIQKLDGKELMREWCEKNPYLSTFPNARSMEREFIFHMGPTNSGKTYGAIQELKKSNVGCYLAPLRLLAHEIYDDLNKDGIYCSLITGEERIEVPGSTVFSSTIEMANFNKKYDVGIIDEIQMITDPQRGWAWTQAVCGLPCEKIYLAGSEECLPYIKRLIEDILKEKLTVIKFERKSPLSVEEDIFDNDSEIMDGDAFIVFSRKRIFEVKEEITDCSVIYGSLSPEVRKSEASKFRDGITKTIISTDAIGMGLNLPIRRIIFLDEEKYNGVSKTRPDPQLIKQIAGRAGRYGKFEEGFVSSTSHEFKEYIKKCLSTDRKFDAKNYKFMVSPNINLIQEISKTIGTTNLDDVLTELKEIFYYDETFDLMSIQQMVDVSSIINHNLDLETKYVYSCSPINLKLEKEKYMIRTWSDNHHRNKQNFLRDIPKIKENKNIDDSLWFYENHIKLLTCYIWLSYRFPEFYPDANDVLLEIQKLNDKIIKILDKNR